VRLSIGGTLLSGACAHKSSGSTLVGPSEKKAFQLVVTLPRFFALCCTCQQ
jgi:hypothetical protein